MREKTSVRPSRDRARSWFDDLSTSRVIFPLAFPGLVAGSTFVFSLTMGDFVAPQLVGGGSQVLGGAIKDRFGGAADYPFGAALAMLALVTLVGFLFLSRRSSALEHA